jgi:hypothetical protein
MDRDMSRGKKPGAQKTEWRRMQQYDIGLLLSPLHLHTPQPILVLGWLPVRASAHSARASFTLVSHPSCASLSFPSPDAIISCGMWTKVSALLAARTFFSGLSTNASSERRSSALLLLSLAAAGYLALVVDLACTVLV